MSDPDVVIVEPAKEVPKPTKQAALTKFFNKLPPKPASKSKASRAAIAPKIKQPMGRPPRAGAMFVEKFDVATVPTLVMPATKLVAVKISVLPSSTLHVSILVLPQ